MKTRIAININNEVAILNELFARLDCSMARYLSYGRPWVQRPNTLLDALVRRRRDLEHGYPAVRSTDSVWT